MCNTVNTQTFSVDPLQILDIMRGRELKRGNLRLLRVAPPCLQMGRGRVRCRQTVSRYCRYVDMQIPAQCVPAAVSAAVSAEASPNIDPVSAAQWARVQHRHNPHCCAVFAPSVQCSWRCRGDTGDKIVIQCCYKCSVTALPWRHRPPVTSHQSPTVSGAKRKQVCSEETVSADVVTSPAP